MSDVPHLTTTFTKRCTALQSGRKAQRFRRIFLPAESPARYLEGDESCGVDRKIDAPR